jgi:hypothetical protein
MAVSPTTAPYHRRHDGPSSLVQTVIGTIAVIRLAIGRGRGKAGKHKTI